MAGGVGNVNGHGLPDGLSVVQGLDHGQVLGIGVDDIGDPVEDGGPLVGGDVFPAPEGGPGGVYGLIHVLSGGLGAGGQTLAVGGAASLEGGAVAGIDPLAVDVKLVAVLSDLFHKVNTPFKR